ncbi:hypothetical protein LEP1GSC061_0515 [Leptospira wolffii serovar Khorat str. Khorat-H2]|nr:hypothetical protein LEP1GSC061_0515 [Leptospira wolffii serovar Khorat str. Khorat-H2]
MPLSYFYQAHFAGLVKRRQFLLKIVWQGGQTWKPYSMENSRRI